jgi:hypothetical protein
MLLLLGLIAGSIVFLWALSTFLRPKNIGVRIQKSVTQPGGSGQSSGGGLRWF